jgi:hypothetical protein
MEFRILMAQIYHAFGFFRSAGAMLTKEMIQSDVKEVRMTMTDQSVVWKNRVDQLAKQVADLALRLAVLPSDGLRTDAQTLDAIEQLAMRILREVSAVRTSRPIGETSGMWRAMPPQRQ